MREEVAAYWYSSVRQYKFNRPPNVLQASQGPFTQMVWQKSQQFGVGKARSRSGKIIVVAHYTPAGNIEHTFKENVLPLNTRALAAEILGEIPGLTSMEQVDGSMAERVMGVLAAQPPRLTGRNATKVIAAHLLGHTASLVTTPDEELQVVINRYSSPIKQGCKRAASWMNSGGPSNPLNMIPVGTCCPPRFRLRMRASVSPADIQSSVIHEPSEGLGRDDEVTSPSRHWLEPQSSYVADEVDDGPTEVIELKRGDLGTPSSDMEDISSLNLSASSKDSSRPKRPRLRRGGRWGRMANSGRTDLEAIRSESFDSVDSQSHPEPTTLRRRRENGGREPEKNQSDDQIEPVVDKCNLDVKLPFEITDGERRRTKYYALSPMRY
ncbi:Golgi-associated plant pathogenesis-related protein 1-like 2 [Homarus americanus]|uniref:Golgi-associated plant pathogenesis-related protein 1-like 2 n=1 Tax=Homarus americanus TaxID=6706 RepID=A0A8J5JM52_HOMAM|nr:Golgi-associated plant pathogenesis-related protein 1-like 2 [Homarus americanus]